MARLGYVSRLGKDGLEAGGPGGSPGGAPQFRPRHIRGVRGVAPRFGRLG